MKKNVLITGGAGFIGSNMAAYQLAQGNQVWITDNLVTGRLSNIKELLSHSSVHFDQADIISWPNLLKAIEWADHIFHFAGSVGQKFVLNNPNYTISNNIHGCEEILKAMAQVNQKARLLIASTSELYCHSKENTDGTVSEDAIMSFLPNQFLQDTYPVSKFVNEIMALAYGYEKGLHCTIARIFNTIGVNQSLAYGMVVPTFINQAINNLPLTIYGDGLQTRSFSDVRDTISALDLLINTPKSLGEIVNVGNDKECRILDLAHLVLKITNSQSKIVYISYQDAYGVPFTDVRRRQPSLKKLKELTNFQQKWSLEDTIQNILNHL